MFELPASMPSIYTSTWSIEYEAVCFSTSIQGAAYTTAALVWQPRGTNGECHDIILILVLSNWRNPPSCLLIRLP